MYFDRQFPQLIVLSFFLLLAVSIIVDHNITYSIQLPFEERGQLVSFGMLLYFQMLTLADEKSSLSPTWN